MQTRSLQVLDIPDAIELWRTCDGVGISEGDTPQGITAFLARNPGTSQVAYAAERLVGAVLAGHDGRRGFLYHLAVHADFRGAGLGRALCDGALAALHDVGIDKCHVMVFRNNDQGRAFWTHLGWRKRDDIDVHTLVRSF
jgi:N-acetylglutamate synthase